MKLGELFVELSAKVTNPQAIQGFKNSLNSLSKDLRNTGIAFAAAGYALDRFIAGTTNSVASLESLAAQTGLSADELQRWSKAASLANLNLSSEAAMQSIAGLEKSLASLRLTGQGMGEFMRLGVNPTNAFDVLNQLRDRINLYDPATASYLLSQIGLSPEFVSVLKLSREEFDKLGRSYFLSKQGRESILANGRAIADMKMRLIALKDQAVLKLSPAFLKLANELLGWINKNQKNIVEFISWIARVAKDFTSAVGNAIGLLSGFMEKVFGVSNGLKAVLLILGGIAIKNSFLGKIFLLIGLLDDIAVWKAGGESMFGGVYDWVKKIIDKIIALKKALIDLKEYLFPSKDSNGNPIEKSGLQKAAEGVMRILGFAAGGALLGAKMGGTTGAAIGAQAGLAGGIFKELYDFFAQDPEYQRLVAEGEAKRAERHSNNITNSQNNKTDIYINGNADKKTVDLLTRQLQNAYANTGNGVR